MGKKKFAKNSEDVRHFRLVARSQYDSRGDTPGATPLVLEPFAPTNQQRRTGLSEAELAQVPESLEEAVGPEVFGHEGDCVRDNDSAADEDDEDDLDGDCYFPKDGYNYDQHLRNMSGGKAGSVGGVVLEATQKAPEKEIKLQPARDDETEQVLRALEHAEEYEELEDESIVGILPGGFAENKDCVLWGPTALENQDLPDLALFCSRKSCIPEDDEEGSEGDEDASGRRGRRVPDEGDQEFDEFLAEEYGEDEIGAREDEEIEGKMTLENCEEMLDDYIKGKQAENEKLHSISEPQRGIRDAGPRVIEETRAIIEKYYSKDESDEDTSSGEESEDESRTWDCESVLSTLSNISNRPGKIGRIKVVKKPESALKPVREQGKDEDKGNSDDEEVVELPDVNTTRPRGETPEERRLRKASVKEMRRVCRKMKKESKEMYKSEALKLPGQNGTADVRAKTRCVKL